MPNFTIPVKNSIVEHIKARCLIATPDYNVFITPWYFASIQDFYATVKQSGDPPWSKLIGETFRAKYIIISYGNFKDSKNKGWDVSPTTYPAWTLDMYHGHLAPSLDALGNINPNSHDNLVNSMINLRNDLLVSRAIPGFRDEQISLSPLEQIGDMILAGNCPFILNDVGDWMKFRLTTEIT